jgi:hypothetical protein
VRPNGLPISRAPARITSLDRENGFQKTPDLERPSRGVGCMGVLARRLGYGLHHGSLNKAFISATMPSRKVIVIPGVKID